MLRGRDGSGVRGVGDEGAGLAVADDVGGLVGREVPVHVGEPEPGPVAGRPGLGELGAVAAQQRHGVALAEPAPAQGPHELVGVGVELGEGAVAARRDDGGPVRVARRPERRRHAGSHGRVERGGVVSRERGRHRAARACSRRRTSRGCRRRSAPGAPRSVRSGPWCPRGGGKSVENRSRSGPTWSMIQPTSSLANGRELHLAADVVAGLHRQRGEVGLGAGELHGAVELLQHPGHPLGALLDRGAAQAREALEHAVEGEDGEEVLRPVADVDVVLGADVLAAAEEVGGHGPAVLPVAGGHEPAAGADVAHERDVGVLEPGPERVEGSGGSGPSSSTVRGVDEDGAAARAPARRRAPRAPDRCR